jgi:hypothetical protein
MTKPIFAHQFNSATQAQIARQLYAAPKPRTVQLQQAENKPMKNRIRQNSAGLNKTEAAFQQYLESLHASSSILSQKITLLIANGCRYTPDFVMKFDALVKDGECEAVSLWAYEVKGFMRDDAAVKLKVAASLYPWIKFHLVSKRKGGGWDVQEVLA